MKAQLSRWADRIDALSLRERVFLFLSLAVLLMALADQLVISSSLKQQAGWNAQLKTEEAALSLLRQQLQSGNPGAAGDTGAARTGTGPLLRELSEASQTRDQLRQQLELQNGPGVRPAELSDLMGKVLQRHPGVSLVQMATVPPAAVASPGSGSPGQSVWVSVSGPYAELQGFVATLESQLPGLRWGELHLKTDSTQALLSVQVWLKGDTP
jgi:MSHA biogenesis protein MshJ